MKLLSLVVLFFALCTCVQADTANIYDISAPSTWNFSFSTDQATCDILLPNCLTLEAHGTFTLQLYTTVVANELECQHLNPWYQIVGMSGEMNGIPISFTPNPDPTNINNMCADQLLPSHDMRPSEEFDLDPILFSTGSNDWTIYGPDLRPLFPHVVIQDSNGDSLTAVNWSVVPAPEPTSLMMLLVGAVGVFALLRLPRLI
jgi:hypothetical protein